MYKNTSLNNRRRRISGTLTYKGRRQNWRPGFTRDENSPVKNDEPLPLPIISETKVS